MDKGLFRRLQEEMEIQESGAGITAAGILTLPPAQRKIVNTLTRGRVMTRPELLAKTGLPQDELAAELAALVEQTYVREMEVAGEFKYKVVFARKRGREIPLNLWGALGERVE